MVSASTHLVVIGGGQAAKWLLMGLAERLARGDQRLARLSVSVVERGWEFATGLAWSRHNALPEHQTSLAEPVSRVSFGQDQRTQFHDAVGLLRERGVSVDLRRGIEIEDLRRSAHRLLVTGTQGTQLIADVVVLATGHWEAPDPLSGATGYHASPWPAEALQERVLEGCARTASGRPKQVLILGTYLNAVDAVISLSLKIGRFIRRDGVLDFDGPGNFRMALASRRGHLPRVWGRAPGGKVARLVTPQALEELRATAGIAGFLPLAPCLDLLDREITGGAAHLSGLYTRVVCRHRSQQRTRVRLTTHAVRRRLERDIRSVFAPGHVTGRYADTIEVPWQAGLYATLPVLSEHSHGLCAEEQYLFDEQLRTAFFQHVMPMTLDSALMLQALLKSGHLTVIGLGDRYRCLPTGTGFEVIRQDTDDRKHTLQFTDVVRACAASTDIRRHPAPLFRGALRSGVLQPAAREFRDSQLAEWIAERKGAAALMERRRRPHLVLGGVQVDPRTREVVGSEPTHRDREGGRIFAMGPNLIGQFLDAHSIGQLIRDSACILSALSETSLAAEQ